MKRPGLVLPLALTICTAAAIAQAPVSEQANTVHRRLLTLDTHIDTPMHFMRPDWDFSVRHDPATDIAQVDLPRMKAGGLDGGFFAIFVAQGPRTAAGNAAARDAALMRAMRIRETVMQSRDQVALAFSAEDAGRIASTGRVAVYQSIENAYPLTSDLSLLATFRQLGVRMVGITHVQNNDFGDSSTDPKGAEWNGLSPLGRDLVREANRLGLLLDASHASDAALDQMFALSRTPIVLSHSGCKAVYDHPRNVDDARIRRLAALGGVIQINAYGDYLAATNPDPERDARLKALYTRARELQAFTAARMAALTHERAEILAQHPGFERSFEQFTAHLLHALALVGPEHVGIGLDWDGGGGVTEMTDVASIPRITQALLDAGYGEADIGKIWSGNVLRILGAAEAAAGRGAAAPDAR